MQNLILKLNLALSGNMTTKLHVYGVYLEALLAKSIKVHFRLAKSAKSKGFSNRSNQGICL